MAAGIGGIWHRINGGAGWRKLNAIFISQPAQLWRNSAGSLMAPAKAS